MECSSNVVIYSNGEVEEGMVADSVDIVSLLADPDYVLVEEEIVSNTDFLGIVECSEI